MHMHVGGWLFVGERENNYGTRRSLDSHCEFGDFTVSELLDV